jgi:hypothetical protein
MKDEAAWADRFVPWYELEEEVDAEGERIFQARMAAQQPKPEPKSEPVRNPPQGGSVTAAPYRPTIPGYWFDASALAYRHIENHAQIITEQAILVFGLSGAIKRFCT